MALKLHLKATSLLGPIFHLSEKRHLKLNADYHFVPFPLFSSFIVGSWRLYLLASRQFIFILWHRCYISNVFDMYLQELFGLLAIRCITLISLLPMCSEPEIDIFESIDRRRREEEMVIMPILYSRLFNSLIFWMDILLIRLKSYSPN